MVLDNDSLFSPLAFFSILNLLVEVALWGISHKKQQKLKNENVIKGCINIKWKEGKSHNYYIFLRPLIMSSKIISVYFLSFCETLENRASCLCLIYFTFEPLAWCFCCTSGWFGTSWFLFLIQMNFPREVWLDCWGSVIAYSIHVLEVRMTKKT